MSYLPLNNLKNYLLVHLKDIDQIKLIHSTFVGNVDIKKNVEKLYGENYTTEQINLTDTIYDVNILDQYNFLKQTSDEHNLKSLGNLLKKLTKTYDTIKGINENCYDKQNESTPLENVIDIESDEDVLEVSSSSCDNEYSDDFDSDSNESQELLDKYLDRSLEDVNFNDDRRLEVIDFSVPKKGDVFYSPSFMIGVNTVGTSLRNSNNQLRSEPVNPQVDVSPWIQSTIESDNNIKPLFGDLCANNNLFVDGFEGFDGNFSDNYYTIDGTEYNIYFNMKTFKAHIFEKGELNDRYFKELMIVETREIKNNKVEDVKKVFDTNYYSSVEHVKNELEKTINPPVKKNQTPNKEEIIDYLKGKFVFGDETKDAKNNFGITQFFTFDIVYSNVINDLYVKYDYRQVIKNILPNILKELGAKFDPSFQTYSCMRSLYGLGFGNFFNELNEWYETDKG